MRTLVVLTLVVASFGCQQTNPSAARGAAGAAIGVEPAKPGPTDATAATPAPGDGAVAPAPTTVAAPRDAASGLASGKRTHKP